MMKRLLSTVGLAAMLAFSALFIMTSQPALATENCTGNCAGAGQNQGQGQDQQQGQGQGQGQDQGQGQSTSVTIRGDDVDSPAYAPSLGALANGPCTGKSGGVSFGALGAVALGAQYADEDEECTLRYNIALLHKLGMTELALEMTNDLRGVEEAVNRLVQKKAAAAGGDVASVLIDGTEIDVASITAKSGKLSPDGIEYRADAPYWCGGKKTTGISGSDLKACFGKEPGPNLLARVFNLQ